MKKKVCILTYYCSNSYGAKLQACALYQYIQKLGFSPVMLDVRSTRERPFVFPIKIYQWKHCLRSFFSELFCRKYMPQRTQKFLTPEKLTAANLQYDFYIVGSDQVWNPTINREFCNAFFFDFVGEDAKKISYAASFGTADLNAWTEKQISDAKQLLSRFSAVSVRERQGKMLCREAFGVEAVMACDPTFLVGAAFFKTMLPHPERKSGGGILVFKLTEISKDMEKALALLVKQHGHGKCISGWRRYTNIPGMKLADCYSIPDWLQNIYSADIVVTDSFHAAVFCIMFHKQFCVTVGCPERMSRLIELLNYFHFSDRLCLHDSDIADQKRWEVQIDFSETDRQMEDFRETGSQFLKDNLK